MHVGGRMVDIGALVFGAILLLVGGYYLLVNTFGIDLPELELGHDLADRPDCARGGGRRESGRVAIRLRQGLTHRAGRARRRVRRVMPAGGYARSSSSVAMVDCRISAERRRPDASSADSPRRSVRSTPPRPSTVGTDR